jgi:hypothetical protein
MPSLNEIALLVAVATPVGIIAGLNVYLAAAGETVTLLLPRPASYPSIALSPEPVAEIAVEQPGIAIAEEPLRKAA